MKFYPIYLLLIFLFGCSSNDNHRETPPSNETNTMENKTYPTTGSIERLDKTINQLIPKEAFIEILAEGFTWSEGPLWIEEGQYLLFSDIPPNNIMKWNESDGATLYLHPSGYTGTAERGGEPGSNALILNKNGQLVLCQHGDRRMATMKSDLSNPKSEFSTIVDNYQGKKLNSPNDAVYDTQGNLYFTDPPYGLEKNVNDPAKELDFQGVFRYSKAGQLTLITDKITRPNGIGLSPDEKTLYVSCSDPEAATWTAFTLNDDGTVASERLFYDATNMVGKGKGLPDGLKVDKQGNIWATGPGGVWVFNSEAKVLGKILTGEATSNCAFDASQKTLYMTCDDYLMRIKL